MAAEDWTKDRVEMLRKLCAENLSFDVIGALMGITRSAAIGKAKRLGIQKFPAKPSPRQRPVTASGKRILTPRLHRLNFETGRKTTAKPEPVKSPDDAPAPLMIPLLELTDQMCRWPVNSPERGEEFLFCAHDKERGSPYCSFHERIAWTGRPPARGKLPIRRLAA